MPALSRTHKARSLNPRNQLASRRLEANWRPTDCCALCAYYTYSRCAQLGGSTPRTYICLGYRKDGKHDSF